MCEVAPWFGDGVSEAGPLTGQLSHIPGVVLANPMVLFTVGRVRFSLLMDIQSQMYILYRFHGGICRFRSGETVWRFACPQRWLKR